MAKKVKETKEQLDIIRSTAGLRRVIACAGSGKTMVLTNNIINVIRKGLCAPYEILALTFTRNAAENIRLKIRENIKRDIDSEAIDIFTFNSFGNEIISENSFEFGLGKNFTIINNSRAWQILYEIFNGADLKYLKAGKKAGDFIQGLLNYIESLKNNLISVGELEGYLNSYREIISIYKSRALRNKEEESINIQKELSCIYRKYEEKKTKSNCIDYSDQVFKPYFLFRRNKLIRTRYQQKYNYIFVDEFQDTNIAQAHLLSMLYRKGHNKMVVVGDDDQGIYSFRGACVENILNFHEFEKFRNSHVKNFYLNTNFRSGEDIVDTAASVIVSNKNRFEKEFKSGGGNKKSEVIFYCKKTHTEEASEIAGIIKYLAAGGIKLKEMAILSRKKNFESITRELESNDIKFEMVGGKNFFFEPEILFIISWLNIIEDINDEISIAYILKSGKYKICDRDIFFIKRNPADTDRTVKLIEGIADIEKNPNVSSEAKKRLVNFLKSYKLYAGKSGEMQLKELISLIIEDSGIISELRSTFGSIARKKIKNIESLIRVASDFQEINEETGLPAFITFLKDVAKTDYGNPDNTGFSTENSVKIMSIHAAKGLEFEVVFLPMLWKKDYDGRGSNKRFKIPSELRKDNSIWKRKKNYTSEKSFKKDLKDIKIEEERRIFYVGCSRAKKILVLSHSEYEDKASCNRGYKPRVIVPFFDDIINRKSKLKIINKEAADFIKTKYGRNAGNIYHDYGSTFNSVNPDKKEKKKIPVLERIRWKNTQKILAADVLKAGSEEKKSLKELEIINKINSGLIFESEKEGRNEDTGFFPLTWILDYRRCPLLYKWKHVYSMPDKRSKAAVKGEEVHKYLQNIVSSVFNNGEISEDIILSRFKDKRIKDYMKNFFKSDLWDFSYVKSIMLEQLFYWKIKNYFIVGKLDRVDIDKENKIRVIDYKISGYNKNWNASSIDDSKYRHEFQIKAYIKALSEIYGKPVENIKGSLLYLKDGTKKSVCLKNSEAEKIKESILDDIGKIQGNVFKKGKNCKECSYRNFCSLMLGH
ncbi:MAG: ATP-dependent DNA helicase [Actinomycetota bacterium]|nr:ATP-dependent DNA helicase [Actinomycetota bacterium]